MTGLDPGAAAAATGLTLDTLRYYEREGLIGPIERTASGRRRYDDYDLAWIGIITCLREAGLGIGDLRQFTTILRAQPPAGNLVPFLRERRTELDQRIQRLQAAARVLDDKIAYYGVEENLPTTHAKDATA
jgi:DNA-binding transcriptional MerR regulator